MFKEFWNSEEKSFSVLKTRQLHEDGDVGSTAVLPR